MRKRRGLLFMLVGVVLAALSGVMILGLARQAADTKPPPVAQPAPAEIKKVYVVVAQKDLPENVALSAEDVSTKEFPADFAPPGAIAAPEYAVGKYTTSRVYKGQILVAPLLAESRKTSQLSASVPEGKVAMAVNVNDALNSLGALRAGDRVDVLLTLDLTKGLPEKGGTTQGQQTTATEGLSQDKTSTQITMQNVEILAIGIPAGDVPTGAQGQTQTQSQAQGQASKTITFILDPQEAITLKFIKDSGGIMDLVVRSPEDKRVVKTDAVTLDTIYQRFRFRFPEPLR